MLPVFRRNQILPYFEKILHCIDDLIDEKFVPTDRKTHGKLVEQCQLVLLRILECIAFNLDFSQMSSLDGENVHQAFNDMIDCASRFALMSAIPLWVAKILIKLNWKFQLALKTMKDFVMITVDDAQTKREDKHCWNLVEQEKILINLLIQSADMEKNSLTKDEIFDEIAVSILAGFKTTSTALS